MEELFISYNNFTICLASNDVKTLKNIEFEFEDYYTFDNNEQHNIIIKIILINNKNIYNRYINRGTIKNKYVDKVVLIKERDIILLYDKRDKTITILYNDITEDIMQFIGEVIFSIFGKSMEDEGFYFFHSACVSIKGKGIAIIGERNAGKTSLMCSFLQNGFQFVSNSRIGIKCEQDMKAIGLPSRVGIRYETINKVFSEQEKERFIELREEEYRRKRRKMNITVKDIKNVFKTEVLSETKLKVVLIPVYIPNSVDLKILKVEDREIIDILLKNKKIGVYDPVKYIDNFYSTNKPKFDFENFKKIKFLKVIVNEKNSNELVDIIKNGLKK